MLAKDRNGDFVDPNDPRAVRWCARGALRKVASDLTGNQPYGPTGAIALEYAAVEKLRTLCGRSLVDVNVKDGREAVVALFKKALAA